MFARSVSSALLSSKQYLINSWFFAIVRSVSVKSCLFIPSNRRWCASSTGAVTWSRESSLYVPGVRLALAFPSSSFFSSWRSFIRFWIRSSSSSLSGSILRRRFNSVLISFSRVTVSEAVLLVLSRPVFTVSISSAISGGVIVPSSIAFFIRPWNACKSSSAFFHRLFLLFAFFWASEGYTKPSQLRVVRPAFAAAISASS